MIVRLFSPFLIAVGQVLAILLFFLWGDFRAFRRSPRRIGLSIGFLILHTALQTLLHNYVYRGGMGSLPAPQYIFITLAYYLLFVYLWGGFPLSTCMFLSLIFFLVDNCTWPLISGLSRQIWGFSYLYDGPPLLRVPFILLLWLLESALMVLIRRLLPALEKIQLDRYTVILTLSTMIPFLYIRILSSHFPAQDNKAMQVLVTVCCLIALITLVCGVERTSSEQDKLRSAQMRYILERQQLQFQQKLQDIDSVNRKYHDMKNIILYLESHNDATEFQQQLQKLKQEIRPYETLVISGNETIDILLSEKLAACQEKQISCVPYLDGSLFDFVDPLDLCIIFGNAMDNAIESCCQIPDAASRQISIKAVGREDSVILTFRNTFAKPPDLRSGLPSTTKTDRKNHGYGLGNIRYIMDKYQGELSCRVENQEFVLTLLFLRQPDAEA